MTPTREHTIVIMMPDRNIFYVRWKTSQIGTILKSKQDVTVRSVFENAITRANIVNRNGSRIPWNRKGGEMRDASRSIFSFGISWPLVSCTGSRTMGLTVSNILRRDRVATTHLDSEKQQ